MRRVFRLFGCSFSRSGGTWRVGLLLSVLIAQHVCHAEQPWPLGQHYRARFLDTSGRIVDHTDEDRSTSEGQAHVLLPLRMQANGRVLQVLGPTSFSAAAISSLVAFGRTREAQAQRGRLDASLQIQSGLYGQTVDYYD